MSTAHILVIHADFGFRRAVKETLEELKIPVISVASSDEGVSAVTAHRCSVAILGGDVAHLQHAIDGIEDASPRTTCILLGSNGIDGNVRCFTGRAVDANDFVDLVRSLHDSFEAETSPPQESDEKYRNLFLAVPDPVCIVDGANHLIVDANCAFFDLYGYSRRNLRRLRYEDICAPATAKSLNATSPELFAGEGSVRHRKADGSGFPVSVHARRFALDGRDMACLVIRDLTARNEMESEMAATNTKLKAIIEDIGDGYIVVDRHLNIVHCNRAAVERFAASGASPDGRPLFEAFPLLADTAIGPWIRELREEPRTVSFEVQIEAGGDADWYEVKLSPFETYVSIFFQEISTRKEMELRLRQTQRLEAVGRLAGGVAHDFNNLLTVILGYADMIRETPEIEDDIAEGIGEIRRSADRATGLTQQLLAFSRKQMLQPQVIEPNDLLKSIEKMIRRLIGEDIELTLSLSEMSEHIKVDPIQLEQVVLNLVINARDATLSGGEVDIATRIAEVETELSDPTRMMQPGRYIEIVVSDNGCGMDPETLDHIFEPFFTTKTKDRGTGLGLSTAYGIIKQSGGYLFAESEIGRGSQFHVFLPACPAAQPNRNEESPESVREPRSGKILVVEDEEALRLITMRLLENLGYTVVEAPNGERGAEIAASEESDPFDLVITDVVMPGLSGREMVERIRKRHGEVKVLYMSGYTDDEMVKRGISANGEAFLPKPFSSQLLGRAVHRILEE